MTVAPWSSAGTGFPGKPFSRVPGLLCEPGSSEAPSCDHEKLLLRCDQST